MSADKLVFDLSEEIEGSPNVFVKKDWLNILDNQNQNYSSNQSVIDTSQLSNSNKWMSYREGYLSMPLMLCLATATGVYDPATAATSGDYNIGLKNWFGTIIHSFTLDYAGTTVIQQTPYINMWNAFKLMTSLSWNDVSTQGATIGFYPDDPCAWGYYSAAGLSGIGVANNSNFPANALVQSTALSAQDANLDSMRGNVGFLRRQQFINFDPAGITGNSECGVGSAYSALFTSSACNNLWKSYIYNKSNANGGLIQIAIVATIYLKHIHSFFAMCPLLKGTFLKMTMNLNNTEAVLGVVGTNSATSPPTVVSLTSVSNAVGGVCPLMIASSGANNGGRTMGGVINDATTSAPYYASLSVGGRCLSTTIASRADYQASPLSQSVFLYVPAYTFNPVFEQAYLSSPVKQIKYTDVYQYQVVNVAAGGTFNNLITNGIANIKSVLILPFYSASVAGNTGLPTGVPVFQSPFDPAGTGPTSPLCLFNNFNVVISGQNAIYNTERYAFEHFNNQLYGKNAVNGGMTDGLTSGLIDRLGFDMEYCYYYVDVSRMLPVEESVPKSVQIIGQNQSAKALDLWVFIEYGVDISIDVLTGARV